MEQDTIELFNALTDMHEYDVSLLRKREIKGLVLCICEVLRTIYKDEYVFPEQIVQILSFGIEEFPNYSGFAKEDWQTSYDYVQYLLTLPQPKQRTAAWFAFRKERLTASTDIPTVLGYNKYEKNTNNIMLKKCGVEKPYYASLACLHGTRMEMVAQMLYEQKHNVKVIEFGCIEHPEYSFIGASPDGITETGVMLEIKNPYSRKIVGVPSRQYFCQMQIQLEVCDLEICDFLECAYNFYDTYEELCEREKTEQEIHGCNSFGVLIEVYDRKDRDTPIHRYCPLELSVYEMQNWITQTCKELGQNICFLFEPRIQWWALRRYSEYRVYRNTEWFNQNLATLKLFWDSVLENRTTGNFKQLQKEKKKKSPAKCNILFDNECENELDNPNPKHVNCRRLVL